MTAFTVSLPRVFHSREAIVCIILPQTGTWIIQTSAKSNVIFFFLGMLDISA